MTIYAGPLIDAHHHLWDLSLGKHPWLTQKKPKEMVFGDPTLLYRNYLPPDLRADARRQNLVARLQVCPTPRDGHQVQGLGRVAHEDDLFGVLGADEASDAFARGLVGVGGFDAQGVDATMNVGVGVGVEVDERVDDLLRLLGGRGVVEIDQPPAIDLPLQDGEVGADTLDIEWS